MKIQKVLKSVLVSSLPRVLSESINVYTDHPIVLGIDVFSRSRIV